MNKRDDYDLWLTMKRDIQAPEGFLDDVMGNIAALDAGGKTAPAFFASPAVEKILYCAFALAMSALGAYRLAGAAFAILVP